MHRTPVTSSVIASIGYDEDLQILEVEFLDDGVYQYLGVPMSEYQAIMAAKSHEEYLNSHIKNAYEYVKVEERNNFEDFCLYSIILVGCFCMDEIENKENHPEAEILNKKLENEVQKFFDCIESCKSPEELMKVLIDIDLFQKEHQDILGIPGRSHNEQSKAVLTNELYWLLSNTKRLLEIRKAILDGGLKKFASFSVGGSIGAGYLGYLLGASEGGKLPEVIFGASAGSIFPILFLLWQEALKSNPQETKSGLKGLLSYLPQKLGDKTMWDNGEELIEEFRKSGKILIDLINKGRNPKDGLPRIEDITLGQVSNAFGIIASRKKKENGFQEVIFSGKDNLLNAIIASSNPEVSILGMKFSVLTNTKNKFLENTWNDGHHTNYNPLNYGETLRLENKTQIIVFPFLKKGSEKFNEFIRKGNVTLWDIAKKSPETKYETFQIPSRASKLLINEKETSDYRVMDQNNGWDRETMEYRAKISYIQSLLYFIKMDGSYYEGLTRFFRGIENANLGKEDNESIISQLLDLLRNKLNPNWGKNDSIEKTFFGGYALAKTILGSNYLNEKQKQDLIVRIFYLDGVLIHKELSSDILPVLLPDQQLLHGKLKEDTIALYNPKNFESILRTEKLPLVYFIDFLGLGSNRREKFIKHYESIKKFAPDDFYDRSFGQLWEMNVRNPSHLLFLLLSEPKFSHLLESFAMVFSMDELNIIQLDEDFSVAIVELVGRLKNPKLQKSVIQQYEEKRKESIKFLEEKLKRMKDLPILEVP